MVVKGSKQYRSMVVSYRPLWRMGWIAALTLVICALVMMSFWYGYREAQQDYRLAMDEWNTLHELTDQQAQQLQELNQQVTNTQVDAQVDKATMSELRQEISQLNEQIVALQESNQFYRQLMEPDALVKGLKINSWQVSTASSQAGHFHYELVIQQLAVDHRVTTGKVKVALIGNILGIPKTYSLHELSNDISKTDIPLKLRFYQAIAGDLMLPKDFEPSRIDVSAEKTNGATVTRSFDWVVRK